MQTPEDNGPVSRSNGARIGTQLRVAMASSGLVSGIIDNGIAYFLLIYYSQVLGLSPSLAGAAMGIALVFDAVSDPVIGAWSDRLHSRFGRRHPFMMASLIPVALFYYLLWTPPDSLQQTELFAYLLGVAILLRTSLTLLDVPLNAMVPELSADYDERTSLFNYRITGAWVFGTAMAVVMYGYWIADSPAFPNGIMNAQGYVEAGQWGALFIFAGAVVAVFGTHRYIPYLRPPPERPSGLRIALKEYRETLSDPSFLSLIGSRVISAGVTGTVAVLWVYVQDYIWEFDSWQLMWLMVFQLVAPFFGFFATPWLAKRRDKKPLLIRLSVISIALNAGPVALYTLGWFASPDGPVLFPLMLIVGALQVVFIVMTSTLTASMLSDVVESREVVTGRREEGVLVAFQTFVGKATTGLGAFTAGLVLELIEFPVQAAPGEVPAEKLFQLALVYGPLMIVLSLVSIAILLWYRIDRVTHEANLAKLALRRQATHNAAVDQADEVV